MKISKWTIVRTVMMAIVVLNLILKALGLSVINVEENAVLSVIEALVEIGCIISAWWYNNSFTENAKRADAFFKSLKEEDANA